MPVEWTTEVLVQFNTILLVFFAVTSLIMVGLRYMVDEYLSSPMSDFIQKLLFLSLTVIISLFVLQMWFLILYIGVVSAVFFYNIFRYSKTFFAHNQTKSYFETIDKDYSPEIFVRASDGLLLMAPGVALSLLGAERALGILLIFLVFYFYTLLYSNPVEKLRKSVSLFFTSTFTTIVIIYYFVFSILLKQPNFDASLVTILQMAFGPSIVLIYGLEKIFVKGFKAVKDEHPSVKASILSGHRAFYISIILLTIVTSDLPLIMNSLATDISQLGSWPIRAPILFLAPSLGALAWIEADFSINYEYKTKEEISKVTEKRAM